MYATEQSIIQTHVPLVGNPKTEEMRPCKSPAIGMGDHRERGHHGVLPSKEAQPREISQQGKATGIGTFHSFVNNQY